jgi:hypothetical protein
VAEADLEYLHDLRRAVALPDGDEAALAACYAVAPPRPAWPDLHEETLQTNARTQLDELRAR